MMTDPDSKMTWRSIIEPKPDNAIIIIRVMVGLVFLSEGIQKFILSEKLGSGRFEKIGLPYPEFLASFVGIFEIGCGLLLLLGLLTRLASIPLISIMLVAIFTTKSQILADKGFWEMMHSSRTDWSMLLGSVFLLIKGGGRWSMDSLIYPMISPGPRDILTKL